MTKSYWCGEFEGIRECSSWLAKEAEPQENAIFRRNVEKGLSCG